MILTTAQLGLIMPTASLRLVTFAPLLEAAMHEFSVDSALRQSAFLAQVAHESEELKFTKEIADGSAYEGRLDLGNDDPGDGVRYKGRGLIQITGKHNYIRAGHSLGLDLLTNPALLEEPLQATRSAAWFWFDAGCNAMADYDWFGAITRKINGGFNGLDSRIKYWLRARRECGIGG